MDDNRLFRKRFYEQLHDEPLEPDDPRYVPLWQDGDDVVARIRETIAFSNQSTQLLSGYRGVGKSTELKRLRRDLREDGYRVALIDIEDHLDLNAPVDIADFLLGFAGALGDALTAPEMLGKDPVAEGVWRRLSNWLQSEVEFTEITAKAKGGAGELGLKAELKANPSFRQRLQAHLASSVGRFADEVRQFVVECVLALRKRHSEAVQLVVIVDSIEHARGTTATESDVYAGLERLFSQHEDKLRFPDVHLVYTVPPWLRVRRPNIGSLYDGEGLHILPTQKVRRRGEGDAPGAVHQPGVDHLQTLVSKRGDWKQLLGSRENLDHIILETGGHLRDLIRALASVTLRSQAGLPASRGVIDSALAQLREQLLPIPLKDARWLAKIARSRDPELIDFEHLGTLTRYFDGHLVLSYRNGSAWYDVHPLVRDHVLALDRRASSPPAPTDPPADGT